jgi:hypothetical protein
MEEILTLCTSHYVRGVVSEVTVYWMFIHITEKPFETQEVEDSGTLVNKVHVRWTHRFSEANC